MKLTFSLLTLVLVATLPLGCAGKAIQSTNAAPSDAGPEDSPADSRADALADVSPDVPHDSPADTADADGDGGFKCVCKNWTDDRYPAVLLWRPGNMETCVLDGCPPGKICCATPCVSPDVCHYVTGKSPGSQGCHWVDNHSIYEPKDDCCWDYGYTACVLPEQCAPGGELHHQEYDPEKNNFTVCGETP